MNTQTHLIVSSALLTRPLRPWDNTAVIAGALGPDLSIYVLFVWAKLIAHIPERRLWSEVYWQDPWQTLSAISNSVPLYVVIAIVGVSFGVRMIWLYAASSLIHVALDFPFHASDAHRHFWPLSDWRFRSPLSYWESQNYAGTVMLFEIMIALVGIFFLWQRFNGIWVRAPLLLCLAGFIAVPLYFTLTLG